ncbi:hypothetical protein DL762_007369 [Monosporascus cannonballus]|uniref:Uncharacterized protein n=1 Tax=Monosporascus cannonballus TaxID=155416 RepID=A0ABY0H3P9_9PEZI|nr:hypothetical protein DL762_007369 [Monosporascus cannonballus]
MSAFGAKRKARKITVKEDDEDTGLGAPTNLQPEPQQEPALQATFKTRKPFKQSSLRKSINVNDDEPAEDSARPKPRYEAEDDNEDGGAPLQVRPALGGRPAPAKTKKRVSTASRLSFGPSEAGGGANGDGDSLMLGGEPSTPTKASSSSLAQEATENSAYRKGRARNLPLGGLLPLRSSADTDRLYSKEYLSELQNSTPNTPQDLSTADDEMSLDPSELEGAMVVDSGTGQEIAPPPRAPHQTEVLTEAQIQEKKERRARLAKAQGNDDFISLSDDDNGDQRRAGDSYLAALSRRTDDHGPAPRSETTRLVREDEDLGEGFDAFVEDGGLSLGARAEREARRKQRAQMASLIEAAEGASVEDEVSDDSEAERRAAYEAAQTRKGMDGLGAAERALDANAKEGVVPVPHRIAPLPDLSVLLDEFRGRVQRRRDEVARARARIAELRAERHEGARREPEVQRLLDEAGERYRALVMPGPAGSGSAGGGGGAASNGAGGDGGVGGEAGANGEGDGSAAAGRARALLDQVRRDGPPGTPGVERGLESLGTTPVRPSRTEDM